MTGFHLCRSKPAICGVHFGCYHEVKSSYSHRHTHVHSTKPNSLIWPDKNIACSILGLYCQLLIYCVSVKHRPELATNTCLSWLYLVYMHGHNRKQEMIFFLLHSFREMNGE